MLLNKGNLHWKFLQEHRPFHVSQPGSSAFIPGLLLLLSLFLCPQCILSGSYTSACPQCLSAYSASKLSQKRLCSHILSPNSGTHLSDIWSSRKVHFSKHSAWKKPVLKTLRLTLLSYLSSLEPPPGSIAGTQQHHCSGREKQWVRLKNPTFPLQMKPNEPS